MEKCGVRRGGKYADGLVQRYEAAMGGRKAQIDAALDGRGATSAPPAAAPEPAKPAAPRKSYEQLDAEIAAAREKMNKPKKIFGLFKDGAVIPGHDLTGADDVDVKVTQGEAILPVRTVDAMGGPMAVSNMIHATNGKPPAGVRRGGAYADGTATVPLGSKIVRLGSVFSPGGLAKPISDVSFLDVTNPPLPNENYGNEGRSVPAVIGVQKTPVAATSIAAPDLVIAPTPSTDPRLAAMGVASDWSKMNRAAGQPVQNAEIYAKGRSAAGYGTQTPEMEAAAQARAEASRKNLAGIYERESQARLGARAAQARLQGEEGYASTLEGRASRMEKAALEKTKVGAGSEGLGALRAAQTAQAGKEVEQVAAKQAMTAEYANPVTAPERRKVLAAALGISEAGRYTPIMGKDTMGNPVFLGSFNPATGETSISGTAQAGGAPVEGAKSTSGGKPIVFKNGKWELA